MSYKNFDLNIGKDGIAVLTWDMPERPMNLIDESTIQELDQITDKVIDQSEIKGVVVHSGKDSFSGGADISMLSSGIKNYNKSVAAGKIDEAKIKFFNEIRKLSQVFRKIETCGKPWVAVITGTCMGGGTEFALACHSRIVAEGDQVKIALPEIKVGIFPGAGGTQRVMRMCDAQAGLQFMLRGNSLSGDAALKTKLVDEIVAQDNLMSVAKKCIQDGLDPEKPWDKKGFKLPSGKVYSPAGFQFWPAANAIYRRETHDNYPGGRGILQSVYEGLQLPFDLALEVESRIFAKVLQTKEAKNMIRTLFLSMRELNRGARRPAEIPKNEIKKVGVLGAGFMGAGIAYVTAAAGIDVVLLDRDIESAEKGKSSCDAIAQKAVKRKKMTTEKATKLLNHIKPTAEYADLKNCNLVIEAVFEDRDIKKTVTVATEEQIDPNTILASNTSTLPISSLANNSKRPENFIGIHFFSPVEKMMLVEIIMGEKTSDHALAMALDYVAAVKKTPIVVNDGRGFYTSRVVMTYIREGLLLLGDGVPAAMVENVGKLAGMPVGPLTLADEVALDLAWKIGQATKKDLGEKYEVTALDTILEEMVVKQNRCGKKNKKGFYDYLESGEKNLWHGIVDVTGAPKPAEEFDIEEIKQRLLVMMSLETARIYEEKILTDAREADIGSILGFGFAPFTGGTLSYIDMIGAPKFVEICKEFEQKWGSRFTPNQLLIDMAKNNKTFYPEH